MGTAPTTTSVAKSVKPETGLAILYPLALLLGIGCGVLHALLEAQSDPDPLLSALAVTMCTMALGVARPRRPWRWVLLVGLPVPLVLLIAKFALPHANFTRATLAGSILIALPGVAGAFGGSAMRHVFHEIFGKQ